MSDDFLLSTYATRLEARSSRTILEEDSNEQLQLYKLLEGECLCGDPMVSERRQMCEQLFSYFMSHPQVHMGN